MGCDIHPHIEVKRDYGPPAWDLAARGDLCIPRSYSLFAALAGVRNYEERGLIVPVSEPRGLPADGCWDCREGDDNKDILCGDHSFSWLTLEECEEASRRAIDHGASRGVTRSGLEVVIAMMRAIKDSGGESRFVFGFDS